MLHVPLELRHQEQMPEILVELVELQLLPGRYPPIARFERPALEPRRTGTAPFVHQAVTRPKSVSRKRPAV